MSRPWTTDGPCHLLNFNKTHSIYHNSKLLVFIFSLLNHIKLVYGQFRWQKQHAQDTSQEENKYITTYNKWRAYCSIVDTVTKPLGWTVRFISCLSLHTFFFSWFLLSVFFYMSKNLGLCKFCCCSKDQDISIWKIVALKNECYSWDFSKKNEIKRQVQSRFKDLEYWNLGHGLF